MHRLVCLRTRIAATVLTAACAGCSPGPELAEVMGTVTLDGQPVPNATVLFAPRGPEGTTSTGITDEQGNYALRYTRDREGAMPGGYAVTVVTEKLLPEDIKFLRENGVEFSETFVQVPSRYETRRGGLTAEVKAGETNRVDLELTSDPPD